MIQLVTNKGAFVAKRFATVIEAPEVITHYGRRYLRDKTVGAMVDNAEVFTYVEETSLEFEGLFE